MSNILANGTDLDDIFVPRTGASTMTTTNIQVNGTDLRFRYAPYTSGTKAAITNIQANGTDLKDIFAPKLILTLNVIFDGAAYNCGGSCNNGSCDRTVSFTVGWSSGGGGPFIFRIKGCQDGSFSETSLSVDPDFSTNPFDPGVSDPACCNQKYRLLINDPSETEYNSNYNSIDTSLTFTGNNSCSCFGTL